MDRIESAYERVPQQDLLAEQSTLGSMMIDRSAMSRVLALGLVAADFYRPAHQVIFETLVELKDSDKPVDLIVLQEALRAKHLLEDAGGTEYLMALVDTVLTAANAEHYGKIVQKYATARKIADAGLEVNELIASGSDPMAVLAQLNETVRKLNGRKGSGLVEVGSLIGPWMDRIQDASRREGVIGYTSGFSRLDIFTGGYGQPLFVVMKAPREKGKTHLMIGSAINCLRSGRSAAIFSLDTSTDLMLARFVSHLSGINSRRVSRPQTEEEWSKIAEAAGWLYDHNLRIYDKAGITVPQIAAMCETMIDQTKCELGFIGIDYAEKLGTDQRYATKEQELTSAADALTNLRNDLRTTIFLLSQVNKEGGERNSQGIGNACDLLMTWQVDEIEGGRGTGKIFAEKNRLGPSCNIDCVFDWGTSRIREASLDYSDPVYPPSWPWWYDSVADDFQENPNVFSMPGQRSMEES